MNGSRFDKVCFIAPSTALPKSQKKALNKTIRLLKSRLGLADVYLSPFVYSCDENIDHVTASAQERSEHFKKVIREQDLVFSVNGGTGAEDLVPRLDKKDYDAIRTRKPVFVGFSDFTFLIHEIYHRTKAPSVYFPALRIQQNPASDKVLPMIQGEEIEYKGSKWLTPPPLRKFSGIPIGGNLSTFVNFLNREKPPKFNWKRHVLFFEDLQIDVEDLHRMLAALKRHKVFRDIRGIVIGSLSPYGRSQDYRKQQKEALDFVLKYLDDVIRRRAQRGLPLPVLTVSNFGHNIERTPMAVPVGGFVTISRDKKITFRLNKPRHNI